MQIDMLLLYVYKNSYSDFFLCDRNGFKSQKNVNDNTLICKVYAYIA